MKTDYYLRILNNTTGQIEYRKWFENVTYREAILKAIKYITENTTLKKNLSPNIDIRLLSIEKGKVVHRIMKWNKNALTDGTGHFSDWVYCQKTYQEKNQKKGREKESEKLEARSLQTTNFALAFFTVVFIIGFIYSQVLLLFPHTMLPEQLYVSKTLVVFVNSMLIIVLASISSSLKDNLSQRAKNTKDILIINILLDLPSWLVALSTLIYFFNEDIPEISTSFQVLVAVMVVVSFGVKLKLDYVDDTNKFYTREFKKLF